MNDITFFDDGHYLSWLARLLDRQRFDVVVPVERKATALLRALLDLTPQLECNWDWSCVLSSDALPYLPSNWLKGKRILIFNEMIHKGHSTKAAIDGIGQNTPDPDKHIETAAFVVHDEFTTSGCWTTAEVRPGSSGPSPDHALVRSASNELYSVIRERLIQSLRHKGALLLDTEHLESTFTYSLPHRRLIDALRSFGTPIEYEDDSDGTFPGITIRSLAVPDIETLRALVPEGSCLNVREPQKIRLVRRGPNESAFIPIWYPPIPEPSRFHTNAWLTPPSYVARALTRCPPEQLIHLIFHLTSLVTGVELIRSAWAGLAPFVGKGIEPHTLDGSITRGSPLGHLRALYPLLDFEELQLSLSAAVAAHKDKAIVNRVHKEAGWSKVSQAREEATVIDGETRRRNCIALLVEIIREQTRFSIDDEWFDDVVKPPRKGLSPFTWKQFWDAGERLNIAESVRTIIMDTAIDNALLKTTHCVVPSGQERLVVRAFEPDSEFAFDALEKLAFGAEEVLLNE